MRSIVIGAEQRVEIAATSALQRMQERSAATVVPVLRKANVAAVGEAEAGQVDGLRTCMPAERRLLTMIDVAAGITADMLDDTHW